MTKITCPKCGGQNVAVARNMKGTRICPCGHRWDPPLGEIDVPKLIAEHQARLAARDAEVRRLREALVQIDALGLSCSCVEDEECARCCAKRALGQGGGVMEVRTLQELEEAVRCDQSFEVSLDASLIAETLAAREKALRGLEARLRWSDQAMESAEQKLTARDAEVANLRKLLAQVCNRVPHFNYREQRWDVSVPKDWPRQRDKALGQGGGGE